MLKRPERKIHKFSPIEMYTGLLERKFKANVGTPSLTVGGDAKMRLSYDKIITNSSIRKYYVLSRLSMFMPEDMIALMRTMEEENDSLLADSGVSINFNIKMEPHTIPWGERVMQMRSAQWEKEITESEDSLEDTHLVSDKEIETRSNNTWLKRSWQYFKKAAARNRTTPVMQVFVELCANSNSQRAFEKLKIVEEKFITFYASRGFEFKLVKGNLWDFLKMFAPISTGNPRLEMKTPKFTTTDENISSWVDYSPGNLSDTEVLLGIDIDTGKFVYKDFVRKFGEAEVLVIAAYTGGGKSFFLKGLNLGMLLNYYSVIVMDRDGEYIDTAKYFGGTVISMSRGAGLYFDSTIIAELTGDKQLDDGLLIDSTAATTSTFDILADAENGMTSNEKAIFSDAYNNLFLKHGIDRLDNTTWNRSINLSYHKLYAEIKALAESDYYATRYGKELSDFIDKLRVFFEPDGIESYLFKKSVNISEIYDKIDGQAPFIVLHMDLKDEGTSNKLDQATLIKLSTTSYLSDMILNHNKKKKRFTFDIVEEFQRYLYNVNAKGIVVTKATGGRKRNAITTIVTNNPGELAASLTGDKALDAIRSNITTSIIGKIGSLDDITPICRNLGLTNCEGELEEMFLNPDIYKHCFVARIDGVEAAVIKAVVPDEFIDTPLFQTRDTSREI